MYACATLLVSLVSIIFGTTGITSEQTVPIVARPVVMASSPQAQAVAFLPMYIPFFAAAPEPVVVVVVEAKVEPETIFTKAFSFFATRAAEPVAVEPVEPELSFANVYSWTVSAYQVARDDPEAIIDLAEDAIINVVRVGFASLRNVIKSSPPETIVETMPAVPNKCSDSFRVICTKAVQEESARLLFIANAVYTTLAYKFVALIEQFAYYFHAICFLASHWKSLAFELVYYAIRDSVSLLIVVIAIFTFTMTILSKKILSLATNCVGRVCGFSTNTLQEFCTSFSPFQAFLIYGWLDVSFTLVDCDSNLFWALATRYICNGPFFVLKVYAFFFWASTLPEKTKTTRPEKFDPYLLCVSEHYLLRLSSIVLFLGAVAPFAANKTTLTYFHVALRLCVYMNNPVGAVLVAFWHLVFLECKKMVYLWCVHISKRIVEVVSSTRDALQKTCVQTLENFNKLKIKASLRNIGRSLSENLMDATDAATRFVYSGRANPTPLRGIDWSDIDSVYKKMPRWEQRQVFSAFKQPLIEVYRGTGNFSLLATLVEMIFATGHVHTSSKACHVSLVTRLANEVVAEIPEYYAEMKSALITCGLENEHVTSDDMDLIMAGFVKPFVPEIDIDASPSQRLNRMNQNEILRAYSVLDLNQQMELFGLSVRRLLAILYLSRDNSLFFTLARLVLNTHAFTTEEDGRIVRDADAVARLTMSAILAFRADIFSMQQFPSAMAETLSATIFDDDLPSRFVTAFSRLSDQSRVEKEAQRVRRQEAEAQSLRNAPPTEDATEGAARLGLTFPFTKKEVDRAFRQTGRRYHPDTFIDGTFGMTTVQATEHFKLLGRDKALLEMYCTPEQ